MQELKPALIPIGDVRTHPQCQDRTGIDQLTVGEYAEQELDDFPPIKVFAIDGELVLAIGHHTLEAHKRAGREKIKAICVKGGTLGDAILAAVRSNSRHGLRRSSDDKRRAIMLLLEHYPNWSTNQIADAAGVSAHGVEAVRAEIAASAQPCENTVERGDKRHSADGKKRPATADAAKQQQSSIRTLLKDNPDMSDREAARVVGCSPNTVAAAGKKPAPTENGEAEATPAPAPKVVVDKVGVPIGADLEELFASPGNTPDVLALLRSAQDALSETSGTARYHFLRPRLSRRYKKVVGSGKGKLILPEIETAIAAIEATRPYAGCPYCAVKGKKCGKDGCKGAGFLTEEAYKIVPAATKKEYESKRAAQ